jgi:hypothetical protein
VDRDGDLDIVASRDSGGFTVMFANGDGAFAPPLQYPAGFQAKAITLADIDGDGSTDIVAANDTGNLAVLFGIGHGLFTGLLNSARKSLTVERGEPSSVMLGDVDGDGDLDMVTANYSENAVLVFFGDGHGDFPRMIRNDVGLGPLAAAVGDLDRDGDLDIVAANSGNCQALYLPDGTHEHPCSGGNSVTVLIGHGDGTFTQGGQFDVGPRPMDVELGDFDGDGDLDVITANASDYHFAHGETLSVLLADGHGSFDARRDYTVAAGPAHIRPGDVDEDGDLDLVVAYYRQNFFSVLLNEAGDFSERLDVPWQGATAPEDLLLADVNADGHLDLISTGTPRWPEWFLDVFFGDGSGAFIKSGAYGVGWSPVSVSVGDVDLDGAVDIVTVNGSARSVSVLFGDRRGSFGERTDFSTGRWPNSVALGDLDRDGDLDIVTAEGEPAIGVHLNAVRSPLRSDTTPPTRPTFQLHPEDRAEGSEENRTLHDTVRLVGTTSQGPAQATSFAGPPTAMRTRSVRLAMSMSDTVMAVGHPTARVAPSGDRARSRGLQPSGRGVRGPGSGSMRSPATDRTSTSSRQRLAIHTSSPSAEKAAATE